MEAKPILAIDGGKPVREKPYPAWPEGGARERELLEQVLASPQWGGYHEFVGQFEELFASFHDAAHGVAVANGTLALELSLLAGGVGRGDEVIVPAHSFIATASAVSRAGATPVFVDIDRGTYNLTAKTIEKALSEKTRAVIVVHFAGLMAEIDEIEHLASTRDLLLIEDAAQAHGAEWHGRRAGSVGRMGCFSFQNSKAMTAGEGGIVLTSDSEMAAKLRSLANCGRRPEGGWFDHFDLGSNFRLSGLQAAVLLAQLERLPGQIRLRQQNFEALSDGLEHLYEAPSIEFQVTAEAATTHTRYLLVGRVEEKAFGAGRDRLLEALQAEGIPCRPFYPHPLYKNPMFERLPKRAGRCPQAERACREAFWIPQQALMGSVEDTLDIACALAKIHAAVKPRKARSRRRKGNGANGGSGETERR